MKITITTISERQRARFYIYKKQKTAKRLYKYIYKKPDTFRKARQFALRFHLQKARHFPLRDFS